MKIDQKAFQNHTAILGKTGSGKTSVAKSTIVEPALERGERVCIVDPTGAWWGLRSKASGKTGAFDVVIFGGDHADMPLSAKHAQVLAETVGTSNTPTIFDTSLMSIAERSQFFTTFAQTLLRRNRGPLNVIVDEMHLFAPKAGAKAGGQTPAMLNAANELVSGGRSRGLRITMISQRPAKLHNDCLTQAETLIAMRLIYPHDRNAVFDWVKDQGEMEQGKEIVASLPGLAAGEGWLWAPELSILERIKFPRPRTFDSSSAPIDTTTEGPVLSPINLTTLSDKLKSVEAESRANDPRLLRAHIHELEKELARKPKEQVTSAEEIEAALQNSADYGMRETIKVVESALVKIDAMIEEVRVKSSEATIVLREVLVWTESTKKNEVVRHQPIAMQTKAYIPRVIHPPINNHAHGADHGLKKALNKVLDAIAWWNFIGTDPVERLKVCVVAGYSPKASTFGVYVADLAKQGLIESGNGVLRLTKEGRKIATFPTAATHDDLLDLASSLLKPQEDKMFRIIYDAAPNAIERRVLFEKAGLSPNASTGGVYLAGIMAKGIVEKAGSGQVAAARWLFR